MKVIRNVVIPFIMSFVIVVTIVKFATGLPLLIVLSNNTVIWLTIFSGLILLEWILKSSRNRSKTEREKLAWILLVFALLLIFVAGTLYQTILGKILVGFAMALYIHTLYYFDTANMMEDLDK